MNDKLCILADTLVNYSLKVKENDRVLIQTYSEHAKELVKFVIDKIVEQRGIPFVKYIDQELEAYLMQKTEDRRVPWIVKQGEYEVENFDCFLSIRYTNNDYVNKLVPDEVIKKIGSAKEEVDDIRINHRRWVLLNYPSHLDAYKARMTNEEFYQYALDVMIVDYASMWDRLQPLKELMERTDMVHIVGPNTDISFSIKGIPVVPCCGESNIPDGEIFTAPIRDSVNGQITYNTPSPYQGNVFHNVSLIFEKGKIIEASCNEDNQLLNKIFDTDLGARYIGEFSLGLNPKILHPMGDILYDEKIIGSIHFTPGRCYEDADNGNHSSIHWDMVLVQRSEYGGGQIYFDDVLVRDNGLFVLPELKHLNYDLS